MVATKKSTESKTTTKRGPARQDKTFMCRYPDKDEYEFISPDDIKAIYEEKGEDGLTEIHLRMKVAENRYEEASNDAVLEKLGLRTQSQEPAPVQEPEPERECDRDTVCLCRMQECDGQMPAPPLMRMEFCCRDMMQAMLGGSGAVTISMESGSLQVGNIDISRCPYCGARVECSAPAPVIVESAE